jgi:hypothetical protein
MNRTNRGSPPRGEGPQTEVATQPRAKTKLNSAGSVAPLPPGASFASPSQLLTIPSDQELLVALLLREGARRP